MRWMLLLGLLAAPAMAAQAARVGEQATVHPRWVCYSPEALIAVGKDIDAGKSMERSINAMNHGACYMPSFNQPFVVLGLANVNGRRLAIVQQAHRRGEGRNFLVGWVFATSLRPL